MSSIIKPVSFNNNNPLEAEILDHVKRRNFSGYVKKLIAADMKFQEVGNATQPVPEKLTAAERLEEMKKRANPAARKR
jgi:hypothetical protein